MTQKGLARSKSDGICQAPERSEALQRQAWEREDRWPPHGPCSVAFFLLAVIIALKVKDLWREYKSIGDIWEMQDEAVRDFRRRFIEGVLDRAAKTRGLPEVLVMDNGPELTSKAMLLWSEQRGVRLHFIEPGKPNQNAFIESFNGTFRDECLN